MPFVPFIGDGGNKNTYLDFKYSKSELLEALLYMKSCPVPPSNNILAGLRSPSTVGSAGPSHAASAGPSQRVEPSQEEEFPLKYYYVRDRQYYFNGAGNVVACTRPDKEWVYHETGWTQAEHKEKW
ncbi:hypothetical protein BPOR_1443g00020 [Botrytis porri]|uniref:Uncharacterized protein n=1 Tax=Botrytis porri TaxID=87229 RepID=A0A4Z1K659_9HELO|nr:hypothetical protein BPOR_1443g00020 [Botrytis porri]